MPTKHIPIVVSKHTKFAGVRPRDEVLRMLRKMPGVKVDQAKYKAGSDFTTIYGGGAVVIWRSFDGWFLGHYDHVDPVTGKKAARLHFDSFKTEHEGRPWFQQLLRIFLIPFGEER